MDTTFRACRVSSNNGELQASIQAMTLAQLDPGDVVIRVHYSSINYKDALAVTGRGNIMRRMPLNAGVDLAGEVLQSSDARFRPGALVLVTGCGLGESHDGGLADIARVPADWVVPLPNPLSLFDAMLLGTAGFTAALAIDRMEQNGQRPDQKPIAVTGARGGVGHVALDLLLGRGYEAVAMTRHPQSADSLRALGVDTVVNYDALLCDARSLQSAQWGGAIDNVGGDTLAWLTRTVNPRGNIASIGMAGGIDVHTSVMPFILRGISLLGITSANCLMEHRRKIWHRLVTDLKPQHLDKIVAGTVKLDELPGALEKILSGQHQGRYVVEF